MNDDYMLFVVLRLAATLGMALCILAAIKDPQPLDTALAAVFGMVWAFSFHPAI